jgi:hypothetical protein
MPGRTQLKKTHTRQLLMNLILTSKSNYEVCLREREREEMNYLA